MADKALIVFTRNPELGKCKTRLAKHIGDHAALDIYKFLLSHTAKVSAQVHADRYVFYSENISKNDLWDNKLFYKKLQCGTDLGKRMNNAFKALFEKDYKKVLIIGSDLMDLNAEIIETAFQKLDKHNYVIGPAEDGGYYLLGMKSLNENIFQVKNWGTETVYNQTISKSY